MIKLQYKNSGISRSTLLRSADKLKFEISTLRKIARAGDFKDDRASINLCSNTAYFKKIQPIITRAIKKQPDVLVVLGIGGSDLGLIAAHTAVNGLLYNCLGSWPKFYHVDTVDSDYASTVLAICKQELKNGKKIMLNVITKSGGTTETIANFHMFFDLLKSYCKDYKDWIYCTTGRGSKLWVSAKKIGLHTLPIPKKVGGRYSVLSAVGLFPLAILGFNIKAMLAGALAVRKECLRTNPLQNPAAIMASLSYNHHLKHQNVHDLFVFSKDLEYVGKWYRQLMGESVGKSHDKKGNKVNIGLTPTVSVGSTDLHSMAQLYLGGPYDKYTTFITIKKTTTVRVSRNKQLAGLVKGVQGQTFAKLMNAILKGVQSAFTKHKRPFIELQLPKKDEYSIGALFQLFEIQMMMLAVLLEVNPFDQPAVELYKKETRRLLR
jgi:glucose-6-phosphate isomerase